MSTRIAPVHLHDAELEACPDGSLLVRNPEPLQSYPDRVSERLEHWAACTPDRPFLAARSGKGWRKVTYAEALAAARAIGQALLDRGLSAERPVLILSGNGIDHALLALACLHVGVPFVPVSTAYSLVSSDFVRLRSMVELLRPSLVFADDGNRYGAALRACIPVDTDVLISHGDPGRPALLFDGLLATTVTGAVDSAAGAVHLETLAKMLFTSGSTGVPKGVISTHRNLCTAVEMLLMCYRALVAEPPVLVDWLPWSHPWGGTGSLGFALAAGGTFYIDHGRPLPGQIEETVRNLREVAPLIYSSVPKGYEELVPWQRRDRALRKSFFSRVRVLQYTGASLAQHLSDAFDELALDAVGERIRWVPVYGSTEGGLMALCRDTDASRAGGIGLPVPGVTMKLVPNYDQLEVRVQSPCVTPGYWRRGDLTSAAFDEDGFFRTGDALEWMDTACPQLGLRYRGRVAEDFKLATATWVRVGALRSHLLQHLAPEVRDVVIAGENRNYIAVLAVPADPDSVGDGRMRARLRAKLTALAQQSSGSAQRVLRLAFLSQKLSMDAGEVTDKGSLNQRAILRRHSALVEELYADAPSVDVICADLAVERTTVALESQHATHGRTRQSSRQTA
jgi:feruloyl-CoA synthase